MKTYVKRNNKLIHIGEGRLFSKADLLLSEEEKNLPVDANVNNKQIQTGANALTALKNAANISPSKVSTLDGGDIGPEKASTNNAGDNSSMTIGPNTKASDVDRISKELPRTKLVYDASNNQNSTATESISSKRIMEMRRNSIPFTKKELGEFLRTL